MKPIQWAATLALVAMLYLPAAAPGADMRTSSDAVVVNINGKELTLADLERKRPAALFQALTNYYEAQRKTIDEVVDEYLLEQQAQKEGVTVAQLLERHVNSAIAKDPSEETLRVYYEGVETTEPYEAVRAKIIDALRQRRTAKAKTAYLQSLRAQGHVSIRLAPPRAPIAMADTPVRGPRNARVTLLEYADYECPYCQQIQPVLDRLTTEYKGVLAFAYKDYPLSMHPYAQKAAEASHCAGAQGKYWEYHDLLVTTKQLDPAALKAHARTLQLDTKAFDRCLDAGEKTDAVKAHLNEAQAFGLQGTPTFFVNGRYVSGTLTYDRLRAIIDEEIGMAGGQTATASNAGEKRQAR